MVLMNQREIRENCYKCGNRSLVLMKPAPFATDFCDHAQMECSKIRYCDPMTRIPKRKQTKYKEATKP